MLTETKRALRITATAYDAEIARLIQAGAADLALVGIPVSGVTFTYVDGAVIDSCTIDDYRIINAIITYVRVNFGTPSDYDRLKASYDEQKAQLMGSSEYGLKDESATNTSGAGD